MAFSVPEECRILSGPLSSSACDGNNGAFALRLEHGQNVFVIASDGEGWEHVSVSRKDRCPTWGEMCQVKEVFWDDEDTVVQFHPKKSEYVNCHPNCLHLWRPTADVIPTPESWMVGPNDGA